MKLSTFKQSLKEVEQLTVKLPEGSSVPAHFHITEIGKIAKQFIDCGGTLRNESVINFQLWVANDIHHRFAPSKLLRIIQLAEEKIHLEDKEIEVEYQGATIGKYGIAFQNGTYLLTSKHTDCLAKTSCSPQQEEQRTNITAAPKPNSCAPSDGCC